jgi:DNA-binding response OmpR family regulator
VAHTILVVDDDEDIRESLRMILEDEGYDVRTAADGAAAVAAMCSERPCFVVLDLMMPIMNGWEVAGWMREQVRIAEVPVAVVTATPEWAPADTACVMRKPVNLDELLAIIERHCGHLH